jgi:23S rRNA pseudouridine2457 synthase
MVSQFVSSHSVKLLGDLDFDFPEGIHAIGRLDSDSEGLLLLTTDKSMTKRLLHPDLKHKRTYIVQVEREVKEEALQKLRSGIEIKVKQRGDYFTQPCEVNIIDKPKNLPERGHTFREDLAQTWLEITLMEGKNRQIRKMCSGVRHDCKRVIRWSIEDLKLNNLQPGEVREMEQEELFKLLKLDKQIV